MWLMKVRMQHFKWAVSKCISEFWKTSHYTNKDIWSDYNRIICWQRTWKLYQRNQTLVKKKKKKGSSAGLLLQLLHAYEVQTSGILQYTRKRKDTKWLWLYCALMFRIKGPDTNRLGGEAPAHLVFISSIYCASRQTKYALNPIVSNLCVQALTE